MKLPKEDHELLKDLCMEHKVDMRKVLALLATEREFEFKDKRHGIYDALREILKNDYSKEPPADE